MDREDGIYIMMNLICKENEGKCITVSTKEFNEWLKENKIEWIVQEDCSNECAMYIKNYSDIHEPFSFVMYKKFDIDLKKFEYAEINGKTITSKIEFCFEYYNHNEVYVALLNDDTTEGNEYAEKVKTEYRTNKINSVEASYLLLRKDIEPAYWL